jgi:hypothetical protein
MRALWRRLGIALALGGCSVTQFDLPGTQGDEAAYAAAFPYYAEYCALSQISKKPGFGADIRGEIGGHAVFYLNGACRDDAAGYPVLRMCTPDVPADGTRMGGVGLSMNAHFSNAKFVAVPGRDFFFGGGLPPYTGLTRADYTAVQQQARRLGIYGGVEFHAEVFDDMPPGTAREDHKYEVSAATDYAIAMGRGRYCARVPVKRAQMSRMVDFLNAENAPYRNRQAVFRWSVFRDNCIHLAHNALAAAGVWDEWRSHSSLLLAMLDFPVPRNEFVNIMRRTNDTRLLDPDRLYRDAAARQALDDFATLPLTPGALAESRPPLQPNAVYDTELKLIFYDEPILGRYQAWSDAIFADPRRTDLAANLAWFDELYRQVLLQRRPLAEWQKDPDHRTAEFAAFYKRFYTVLGRQQMEARKARALPWSRQVRDTPSHDGTAPPEPGFPKGRNWPVTKGG